MMITTVGIYIVKGANYNKIGIAHSNFLSSFYIYMLNTNKCARIYILMIILENEKMNFYVYINMCVHM